MLRFVKRPTAGRRAFEKKVEKHVEALDKLKNGAEEPDLAAIGHYIEKNAKWADGVKKHYAKAQHRKCGYCERKLTDYGDVEHFRPKNAVWRLKTRGKEKEDLNNIEGRTYDKKWDSGYWWLAYDWDNYLVACGRCNQQWKSALFPVRRGHRTRPAKGDETRREPYILDPFGSVDPEQHLEFTVAGGIAAKGGSRHGRETIEVYGLHRPSCVDARREKATSTYRKVRQLLNAKTNEAKRPILEDIQLMGAPDTVHAGMVRTIFVQNSGWTWEQLEKWLAP